MKYDVEYVALITISDSVEAESLAEATLRARFNCPSADLQAILETRTAVRVEQVCPRPFVSESVNPKEAFAGPMNLPLRPESLDGLPFRGHIIGQNDEMAKPRSPITSKYRNINKRNDAIGLETHAEAMGHGLGRQHIDLMFGLSSNAQALWIALDDHDNESLHEQFSNYVNDNGLTTMGPKLGQIYCEGYAAGAIERINELWPGKLKGLRR